MALYLKKLLWLSSLCFLVSCSVIHKSHINGPLKLTVASDMDASIEVDTTKKLTGYASAIYLLHLFKISGDDRHADGVDYGNGKANFLEKWFGREHAVKSAAAYNAIRTSRADVLVAPQYVIESSNWNPFYKQIKVKVTGFPGKIVSIKNK